MLSGVGRCSAASMRRHISDRASELGVIQVLLNRFNNDRLPYALQLKAQVDRGQLLSEYELHFVKKMLEESQHASRLAARHMKYEALVGQAASLLSEIVSKALENERLCGSRQLP
jgi:hypothetical protein